VVNIPGDHLVLPIAAGGEGFLAAQLIDISGRHVPKYDDPKGLVGDKARHQRLASELRFLSEANFGPLTSTFSVELPGIEPAALPGQMPSEPQFRYISFQFSPAHHLRFRLSS
jgi:hypothetical protein